MFSWICSSFSERKMMRESLGKARLLLSPSPATFSRATVTADDHGLIISCNSAVQEVFGCLPDELVDASVRSLVQFLPKKKSPNMLISQPSEGRFSRTDMWKDLMHDLTSVRVVNAKHKDGTLIPILLTSSEIVVSTQKMYSLLFEPIRSRGGAIITLSQEGIIQSASDNISTLLGVRARQFCGKSVLAYFVEDPVEKSFSQGLANTKYNKGKHRVGAPVDVSAKASDGVITVRKVFCCLLLSIFFKKKKKKNLFFLLLLLFFFLLLLLFLLLLSLACR